MDQLEVIGIMSGTSLDGLDLAYCTFPSNCPGDFKIIAAQTLPYNEKWQYILKTIQHHSAADLAKYHLEYSRMVANQVQKFRSNHQLPVPGLLAFHGHTVFHEPLAGVTFQLGSPAALAVASGIATVGDFRVGNVVLGGQGAPLVPIGDAHLFGDYDACLNLGGFGNISRSSGESIIAYDICAVNMALNALAERVGKEYDENGEIAASGQVEKELLQKLNALPFYQQKPPKSLGREWYEEHVQTFLTQDELTLPDIMATYCEHIAIQLAEAISNLHVKRVLVTGGGAKNTHLIHQIKLHANAEIVVPNIDIVDFKEALIFAYLGMLRWKQQPNCLSAYTGSIRDHCAGSLHLP